MAKITGSCLCGAVRYECDADPQIMGNCYCTDCRKISGTGHCSNMALPEDALKISGDMKTFSSAADSGNEITRHFCPQCGVRLFSTTAGFPGMRMVAAGTLDNPELFNPNISVYTSRAPSWDKPLENVPAFPEMPAGA